MRRCCTRICPHSSTGEKEREAGGEPQENAVGPKEALWRPIRVSITIQIGQNGELRNRRTSCHFISWRERKGREALWRGEGLARVSSSITHLHIWLYRESGCQVVSYSESRMPTCSFPVSSRWFWTLLNGETMFCVCQTERKSDVSTCVA